MVIRVFFIGELFTEAKFYRNVKSNTDRCSPPLTPCTSDTLARSHFGYVENPRVLKRDDEYFNFCLVGHFKTRVYHVTFSIPTGSKAFGVLDAVHVRTICTVQGM